MCQYSPAAQKMTRNWGRLASQLSGITLACFLACQVQAETPSMLEVRALYLYNFAVFVHWPDDAFELPDSPIHYCVLGNRSLRRMLSKVIDGESVQGRALQLKTASETTDWSQCHLLYLDHSLGERVQQVLSEVQNHPVLTVGDTRAFPKNGGMIGLARKGRRVHPVINTNTAAESGIRMSSKLLRLATLIPNNSGKSSP